MSDEHNLLMRVNHVKYRKAGDGRSPIGTLAVFREYVEWRDNASEEVLTIRFINIKGQRVSPPHKPKVQLQLVLKDDEQATFVFMNPDIPKTELPIERDNLKEKLQQALIEHRAHVNQITASNESQSRSSELEAKRKILREDTNLEKLYKALVMTKLLPPQDFWENYFTKVGVTEDKIGINGAFLSTIAQQDGTNGIRLNLNPDLIRAIFNTYPAVERKHLELVPHEMKEDEFWTKFFKSHYFHKERDVLPNPKDPFADCVKIDEEEMKKISDEGVARKRFDLNHLDDYAYRDFLHKKESLPKVERATLIKRCNYVSEKILATSWKDGEQSSQSSKKKGFGVLNRLVEESENQLDSEELANETKKEEVQVVKVDEFTIADAETYPPTEAHRYKSIVLSFFESATDEDILNRDEMVAEQLASFDSNENGNQKTREDQTVSNPEKWTESQIELNNIRDIHSATRELCRHFWGCFPPTTEEAQEKITRMGETLEKFKMETLNNSEAIKDINLEHCLQMIDLALDKFKSYQQRKKR